MEPSCSGSKLKLCKNLYSFISFSYRAVFIIMFVFNSQHWYMMNIFKLGKFALLWVCSLLQFLKELHSLILRLFLILLYCMVLTIFILLFAFVRYESLTDVYVLKSQVISHASMKPKSSDSEIWVFIRNDVENQCMSLICTLSLSHICPDEEDRADLWSIGFKSTLMFLITWKY